MAQALTKGHREDLSVLSKWSEELSPCATRKVVIGKCAVLQSHVKWLQGGVGLKCGQGEKDLEKPVTKRNLCLHFPTLRFQTPNRNSVGSKAGNHCILRSAQSCVKCCHASAPRIL